MMTLGLLGGIAGSAGAVEQGPSIERHPQAIPASGHSVAAAMRALQADEQVRAHVLTRSAPNLRLRDRVFDETSADALKLRRRLR